MGDHAAALTTLERAARRAGEAVPGRRVLGGGRAGDEAGAIDLRLRLLSNRVVILWNVGRQREAVPIIGQAATLAERAGSPSALNNLRVSSAESCFFVGRWDDAMVELEAAATDLPPGYPARTLLMGIAAYIAVHRDDQTTMRTHLRGAEDVAIPAAQIGLAYLLFVARALAAERDGQPEQALAVLLEVWIRNRRDCFRSCPRIRTSASC